MKSHRLQCHTYVAICEICSFAQSYILNLNVFWCLQNHITASGSGDQIWSSTAFKVIAEENTFTISVASDCGEQFINIFVCALQ